MANDNSSGYIGPAPNDCWAYDDLHLLGDVNASDFEAVLMSPICTVTNLPSGSAPTIANFTASTQLISAGTPVTLTWSESDAGYFVGSPDAAVRGTNVTVPPAQSTTYTLYATDVSGRTTATVNIKAH
jgi:hypothetical protein